MLASVQGARRHGASLGAAEVSGPARPAEGPAAVVRARVPCERPRHQEGGHLLRKGNRGAAAAAARPVEEERLPDGEGRAAELGQEDLSAGAGCPQAGAGKAGSLAPEAFRDSST